MFAVPPGFQYTAVISSAIAVNAPPIPIARGPILNFRTCAAVVPVLVVCASPS